MIKKLTYLIILCVLISAVTACSAKFENNVLDKSSLYLNGFSEDMNRDDLIKIAENIKVNGKKAVLTEPSEIYAEGDRWGAVYSFSGGKNIDDIEFNMVEETVYYEYDVFNLAKGKYKIYKMLVFGNDNNIKLPCNIKTGINLDEFCEKIDISKKDLIEKSSVDKEGFYCEYEAAQFREDFSLFYTPPDSNIHIYFLFTPDEKTDNFILNMVTYRCSIRVGD